MKPWLAKTSDGKYKIEHIPCPHPDGRVDMRKPPTGVEHTTEGTNWDGLVEEFKQHFAPHFLVAPHRIAQLVPLGYMAAALEHDGPTETNRYARAQIETVGFSKTSPYSFDAATSETLASLLATLKVEARIPLSRPFPDAMPPQPWATRSFVRRHAGKWGKVGGWYGHVEVPENSHWDPGALRWSLLLDAAKKQVPRRAKLPMYHAVRVIGDRLYRA